MARLSANAELGIRAGGWAAWLPVLFSLFVIACGGAHGPRVVITLAPPSTPESAAEPSAQLDAPPATPPSQPTTATVPVELAAGVPADLLLRGNSRMLHPAADNKPLLLLSPAASGQGVPARYWVPVTDLFNDATALSSDDLRRSLRGEITDWKLLNASAAPLRVLLPAEHMDELRALLSDALAGSSPIPSATDAAVPADGSAPAGPVVMTEREIIAVAGLQRGALALLPLEDVDFHVRALALDGIDLLRATGAPRSYPLATRLLVTAPQGKTDSDLVRAAQAALTAPLPLPERILATGDIIPARCVYDRQKRYNDYRHAFLEVAPLLRTADLAIGSLDASISDKGTPIGCQETFSLMAPAESIQGITYAGIGLLTVAANHAKDCGVSACGDLAFLDTLARLDAAGVAHAGGGRTLAEARTATIVSVKGVRFGFLGYDDIASQYYGAGTNSPGTAPLDLQTLADDVRAARRRADVVIVMVHWGIEYTPDPTERQRQAAKIAVESGATLVVGNHPHVVQAVESFPGGFADYALGNFVFDQDWSQETLEGVVMEAIFDGPRLRQVAFLPLRIQDMHQPHFLTREQGRFILDRMQKASVKVAAPP